MSKKIKNDPTTEWMSKHPQEIFKHAGQYIAISDFKVVASGRSSTEVIQKVHERDPKATPRIMKVPPDGLLI
jgi:hypothetical protein